jgi:Trypsin-like peptidase domain
MKTAGFLFFLLGVMPAGRAFGQVPDSIAIQQMEQIESESSLFQESTFDQETYLQLKGLELGEAAGTLPQLELERLAAFTAEEAALSEQSPGDIYNNLYESLSENNLNSQIDMLGTGIVFEQASDEYVIYFDDVFEQMYGEDGLISLDNSGIFPEVSPETADGTSGMAGPSPLESQLPEELDGHDPSQFGTLLEVRDLNPLISWQKNMLINGRSVGLVVQKSQIHRITDTLYQLDVSGRLGDQFRLCPGELFVDQPVAGEGTTFVIGAKTLVTASHVFSQAIDNYAIVFGYELISKKGAYEVFIPVSNVYFPTKMVLDASEEDIAVYEVDRPLHVAPLPLSNRQIAPDKGVVYMIGHPLGLPKKVALNASVGENSNASYFYTSLDAFQGNSGSPVFLFGTNEVIGILVSGQKDYEWNGQCNRSTNCVPPHCRGEKVVRVQAVFR